MKVAESGSGLIKSGGEWQRVIESDQRVRVAEGDCEWKVAGSANACGG